MKKKALEFVDQALELQKTNERMRHLRPLFKREGAAVFFQGTHLIDFTSNDYLGLSQHPVLKERAMSFVSRYGAGSCASRLLSGNLDCMQAVEDKLARLKGAEAALIFNSGYQANSTLLPALADRYSLILLDRFCHHSLIHGARLSQARMIRFRHNDLQQLETLLQQTRGDYSRTWIVTESVFGMEGDFADLKQLVFLKEKYDALLYVDEAHATGVIGKNGMGLASHVPQIDLIMGTFSKALGSFGSYVCLSKILKEYLINFCPGFIYSTALPPAVIGAIDAALDLIPGLEKERKDLHQKAKEFRLFCKKHGWNTGNSCTHIVPIFLGEEKEALKVSTFLEENGILALAIRPPTVPSGQARLRLAFSSFHEMAHLQKLFNSLAHLKQKVSP